MSSNVNAIVIPVADGLLAGPQKILYGWSVHESDVTPAVASFLIRDGSVAGNVVAAVELTANGMSTEWFGPQGVRVPDGVFIDRVAGTIEGSIYIG